MNITLKQLTVFTTTARLNGITKAAQELSMTQSAASQSLKELENILGYPLFTRHGRKLVINAHGQVLLSKATQMLVLQDQIQQPITTELQGELKVAASVTIGSYVMPQLLAKFIAIHPQVEPKLFISNSEQVTEKLLAGQAHIGLIEAPLSHKSLSLSPWRNDQLVVFCAKDNVLAKQKKLTLTEMSQQRWILREHGSGTRAVFINAMQQLGGTINHSMDLARQEAIKQTVKANLGLGVLSLLSIQEELTLGIFKRLETPLNLNRQLSIIESEHYCHDPLVSAFHTFLNEK
ncbi:LysR substrate-binding domain-containing protein [Colwellia sp. 20A7]|uniref:LysR substrate-binding domain-containing protein n=1 Tax=Colwellia sp. 20A7 TaxID=2689569 RepID=UPI00135B80A0|nr:LysR substrate-binding domain-containing protein [Colwellia sp. 20A7]